MQGAFLVPAGSQDLILQQNSLLTLKKKRCRFDKKGVDLTTFEQHKKGADLTKKGADLTKSQVPPGGTPLYTKEHHWLKVIFRPTKNCHFSLSGVEVSKSALF